MSFVLRDYTYEFLRGDQRSSRSYATSRGVFMLGQMLCVMKVTSCGWSLID
jgi:hypothetical protein